MSRRTLWTAVVLVVAGAGIAYLGARPDGGRTDVILRPAPPALPNPSPREKAAYLYANFKRGARTVLRGQQILLWRDFGEYPLIRMGRPALDVLLAEERYRDYGASPNILAGVLRILPGIPGARDHERLYPFLSHWLDPTHLPSPADRDDWAEDIRLLVFNVLGAFPRPAAVPFCVEELERKERGRDLRRTALAVLLATGHGRLLADYFDRLPPNADEDAPDLRIELILGLYRTLAPGRGAGGHAVVQAMEPVLRRVIDSGRDIERFNAMGVLLRLGHAEMEGRLIEFFETALAEDRKLAAWSALLLLNQDRAHPYVRARCLEQMDQPAPNVGFETAAKLICKWWPDEKEAIETIWASIDGRENISPMLVLPSLLRLDRKRVVAYLEGELRSGETERLAAALPFVVGERLTELGPVLMDLVREVPRARRPLLYHALVALQTPGTEALLLAEMANPSDEVLRGAAATEILNLGSRAGLAHLAEELERGDPQILHSLLMQAKTLGRRGVPEALVGPALSALRKMPDEDDRRTALFIFRYRGTLDAAREGLVEAYRREPSRRLATEIRQVLGELAHR
jgi:hypothetical protein